MRITQRFLEEITDVINYLNKQVYPPPFNPVLAVSSALFLTLAAALSSKPLFSAVIISLSLLLLLISRSPIYTWVKVMFYISLWVIIVSAPLPFITPGEPITRLSLDLISLEMTSEGFDTAIRFVIRVISAAAIFTSFTTILGWKGMCEGLFGLKVPKEIIFIVNLLIIKIPILTRSLASMLLAREARIINKIKIQGLWNMLSTVVGELIIKSYERSLMIERAIRARSFKSNLLIDPPYKNKYRCCREDLFLIITTFIVFGLGLLMGF